jgi:hypothetical protein
MAPEIERFINGKWLCKIRLTVVATSEILRGALPAPAVAV